MCLLLMISSVQCVLIADDDDCEIIWLRLFRYYRTYLIVIWFFSPKYMILILFLYLHLGVSWTSTNHCIAMSCSKTPVFEMTSHQRPQENESGGVGRYRLSMGQIMLGLHIYITWRPSSWIIMKHTILQAQSWRRQISCLRKKMQCCRLICSAAKHRENSFVPSQSIVHTYVSNLPDK